MSKKKLSINNINLKLKKNEKKTINSSLLGEGMAHPHPVEEERRFLMKVQKEIQVL